MEAKPVGIVVDVVQRAARAILGNVRVTGKYSFVGPWGVDSFRRINDLYNKRAPDYLVKRESGRDVLPFTGAEIYETKLYCCSCASFCHAHRPCKHIYLVILTLDDMMKRRYQGEKVGTRHKNDWLAHETTKSL